jgi:hypothetical protein
MATKKDKIQDLRRSQFILTYGPGSILEGRDGPRIIPSLGWGLGGKLGRMLQEYEVHDLRMSFVLRKMVEKYKDFNTRFFVLPSNSSERKVNQGLYRTYIFPVWKICYGKHGKHKQNIPILYDSSKNDYCPICHKNPKTSIRFVCACPDGHLDEVDWKFAVHDSEKSCDVDYFYWNAGGSSLSSIKIKCPECDAETNMGDVYQKKYFKCTGRFPEKEAPLEDMGVCFSKRSVHNCNQRMRVVQRQSTSLRIANTLTLLKIPKYDRQISNILQIGEVASLLSGLISADVDETIISKAIEGSHKIASESKEVIFRYIKDNSFENILIEEFETLRGEKACSDNFCKGHFFTYNIKFGNTEFPFKIYPVDKITTVTAQIGYQRKPYIKKDKKTGKILESPIIPSGAPREDGGYWYPVFEGIGEGIFITSDENPITYLSLNDTANEWIQKKPKHIDRWRENEVKRPEFVWWHSLSHALIKTLSYFSGYSAASIRERVYLDSGGKGGVFLYTTSAGEDCGMGGLVESSEKFKSIIEEALKSVSLCSHDPLCSEIRISSDRVNGSACHYCLFLPETSCEHGNMWLDRHILKGD